MVTLFVSQEKPAPGSFKEFKTMKIETHTTTIYLNISTITIFTFKFKNIHYSMKEVLRMKNMLKFIAHSKCTIFYNTY